jgi:hypothetical protein
MRQTIRKICEDAENRFQPQLGEGRVYFRPFHFHSLADQHVSSDYRRKNPTRPPAGKDDILKLLHTKIE